MNGAAPPQLNPSGPTGPVVWILGAEHWERACLRAELIERGYDAVGYETAGDALLALRLAPSPRPRAILLDLRGLALGAADMLALARLGVPIIALAGAAELAQSHVQAHRLAALLRRPVTLGQVADVVASHAGRPR